MHNTQYCHRFFQPNRAFLTQHCYCSSCKSHKRINTIEILVTALRKLKKIWSVTDHMVCIDDVYCSIKIVNLRLERKDGCGFHRRRFCKGWKVRWRVEGRKGGWMKVGDQVNRDKWRHRPVSDSGDFPSQLGKLHTADKIDFVSIYCCCDCLNNIVINKRHH